MIVLLLWMYGWYLKPVSYKKEQKNCLLCKLTLIWIFVKQNHDDIHSVNPLIIILCNITQIPRVRCLYNYYSSMSTSDIFHAEPKFKQ